MPNYLYKARDESGKLIRGTMDASSKDELASKIRNMGYVPTYVGESKGGFDISAFKGRFSKIGADDIIIFNLQLANKNFSTFWKKFFKKCMFPFRRRLIIGVTDYLQ